MAIYMNPDNEVARRWREAQAAAAEAQRRRAEEERLDLLARMTNSSSWVYRPMASDLSVRALSANTPLEPVVGFTPIATTWISGTLDYPSVGATPLALVDDDFNI